MPTGAKAIKANFMCCIPKGIPTMLTKQARAELRWPIANHQPATRNQITLPVSPSGPVPRSTSPLSSLRFTACWPKGHSANFPMTKHDLAQGSPITVIAQSSPANHQPRAITQPPRTTHTMLSSEVIISAISPCINSCHFS